LRTVARGSATIISLEPEDVSDPVRLRTAFEEIVALPKARHVVVDLGRVRRLTSMGLSALSAGAEVARTHRARFALAGVRPELTSLVERVGGSAPAGGPGESGRVEFAPDVETALRAFEDEEGTGGGLSP
jgi:anti-anti-sigma regulatory factor